MPLIITRAHPSRFHVRLGVRAARGWALSGRHPPTPGRGRVRSPAARRRGDSAVLRYDIRVADDI